MPFRRIRSVVCLLHVAVLVALTNAGNAGTILFIDSDTGLQVAPKGITAYQGVKRVPVTAGASGFTIDAGEQPAIVEISDPEYQPMTVAVRSDEPLLTVVLARVTPHPAVDPKEVRRAHCEGAMLLTGFVGDEARRPLAGVTVAYEPTGERAATKVDGFFQLYVATAETSQEDVFNQLSFAKEGFVTLQRQFIHTWSGGDWIYTLQLNRGSGTTTVDERQFRRPPTGESEAPPPPREPTISAERLVQPTPFSAATAPRVPTNIRVPGPAVYPLDTYLTHVLPSEWKPEWGSLAGGLGMESLYAGAIAARTYAIGFVNTPADTYDICTTTACQVFDPNKSSASTTDAINATTNQVLVDANGAITLRMSEFAAETNNQGCGNKFSGENSAVAPCIADPVCYDLYDPNSHGRGMCQAGSARWATGYYQVNTSPHLPNGYPPETASWILQHYYAPRLAATTGLTLTKGASVQVSGASSIAARDCNPGIANGINCNPVAWIPQGTTGTILDGPQLITADGHWYTWWQVKWNTGSTGWSAENYLQFAPSTSGSINISATLDGNPWSGALNYHIGGTAQASGVTVPTTHTTMPPGGYTAFYDSGGPAASSAPSIDPPMSLNLTAGSSISWMFRFTSAQCTASLMNGVATNSTCSCYAVVSASSPSAGGTVNIAPANNCTGGYTAGTTLNISASANTNYVFSSWSITNCTPADTHAPLTTCTITGGGTATITASFTYTGGCQSPPTAASSPSPADGGALPAGALQPTLSWSASNASSYDVYLAAAPNTPSFVANTAQTSYMTTPLSLGTTYRWYVVPKNSCGSAAIVPTWTFSTLTCTAAPGSAISPVPSNGAIDIDLHPLLAWAPSSNTDNYDVRFGTTNPPPLVQQSATSTTYDPGALAATTKYYWSVMPKNACGVAQTVSTWSFTTAGNATPSGNLWLTRFTYQTPFSAAVAPVRDGGVLLAHGAANTSTGGEELVLARIRPNGSIVWQKTYTPADRVRGTSVRQTADGGFVIGGWIHINGTDCSAGFHVWVLRIDDAGNTLWQRAYGPACYAGTTLANDIRPTYDGGFIAVGVTYATANNTADALVVKLDAEGHIVWQKLYGGSSAERFNSVKPTLDGGYILAGESSSFSASTNSWVVKIDDQGALQWQRLYGGLQSLAVEQASDGGFLTGGYDGTSAQMLRLNSDGSIKWQETIRSSPGGAFATDIVAAPDGGYVVSGQGACSPACDGGSDGWVFQLSDSGSIGWQRTYPGAYNSFNTHATVAATATGGYAIGVPLASPIASAVMRLDGQGQIAGCSTLNNGNATATTSSFPATVTSAISSDGPLVEQSYSVTESVSALGVTNICSAAENAIAAPATVTAMLASAARVDVTWSLVNGASQYKILRRSAGGTFNTIGYATVPPYHDDTVTANTAYLYTVRAMSSGGTESPNALPYLTTTVVFTDDPPVPWISFVAAAHVNQLRTAINAVRSLAGLNAASFTDSIGRGTAVKAIHVTELRSALDTARMALLMPVVGYTNAAIAARMSFISAIDILELRNGVR